MFIENLMTQKHEIIKEIKRNCAEGKQYTLLYDEKHVVGTERIHLSRSIIKICDALDLSIKHSYSNYAGLKTKVINLPTKGQFYSESNYNHAVLHEITHQLAKINGLSKDYASAYFQYIDEKQLTPNLKDLMQNFEKTGKILSPAENNLIVAYAKDETAVELATYQMLQKMGIKPDAIDTAYMNWNISENNKILTSLGKGFNQEIQNLNEIVSRTDKLLTITIKENEKINNVDLFNGLSKKQKHER